jgi:hypothetical protein
MSGVYRNRLRRIQSELSAAREAIAYVSRHWQQESVVNEIDPVITQHDFLLAAANIEKTYFVRLYAEFEGILKYHLATNHSTIGMGDKPKVDWLISRVSRAEGIAADPNLRRKMDGVRDYRNAIAHHRLPAAQFVSFASALSTLNQFLNKLPDPNH